MTATNKTTTKSASNKKVESTEVIKAADVGTLPAGVVQEANKTVVTAPTKADRGRAIMDECYAQPVVPQRKDILARMMAEVGMSKACAATYLQNYKTKKGLVKPRTAATA